MPGRLITLALLLLALLGMSLAWRFGPLADSLKPELLVSRLRELGEATGPAAAVLGLTLALSLAVPLSLLTLISLVALGPWQGAVCVIGAALVAAALSQWIGRQLGHALLLRMAGPKLQTLSQSLERRGLLAVIALRLVPVAPFAIVNMVAGTTHLRMRDMLLGTAIGVLPSTLAMALFTEQFVQALQQPGPERWWLLGGTLALIALGAWGLKRWMRTQAG